MRTFAIIAAMLLIGGCHKVGSSEWTPDADGAPPTQQTLYDIARKGNTAQFDLAYGMVANPDIDAPDPRTGMSIIHYAAANRAYAILVGHILELGADGNKLDAAGLTPMRHAIMANNQTGVRNIALRVLQGTVSTHIKGRDGLDDEETCHRILIEQPNHRACQSLFEVLERKSAALDAKETASVLKDWRQARDQVDLQ